MQLLQDVRYACRTLGRSPGLVITAVLSLGLGIAATTAVFSFVNGLQFKPLPFADAGTLVNVEETSVTALCAGCSVGTSYPTLQDWRARARSFSAFGAYQEFRRVVSGGAAPERIPSGLVSAGLFPMLGIQPVLGRSLTGADDRPGAEPVVVLSDLLWRRRFNADPAVLGSTMKIDGVAFTIVGVMPSGFRFPEFAQFWTALAPARHAQPRGDRSIGVIARLAPGADVSIASVEMRAIGDAIAAEHAATNGQWAVRVRPLHQSMTAETVAPSAVLLGRWRSCR